MFCTFRRKEQVSASFRGYIYSQVFQPWAERGRGYCSWLSNSSTPNREDVWARIRFVSKASKVNTTATERCAQNIQTRADHALLQECTSIFRARDVCCFNYGRAMPRAERLKRERRLVENVMGTCRYAIKPVMFVNTIDVSEEFIVYISGLKSRQHADCCLLLAWLAFDREDEYNMLLRNGYVLPKPQGAAAQMFFRCRRCKSLKCKETAALGLSSSGILHCKYSYNIRFVCSARF